MSETPDAVAWQRKLAAGDSLRAIIHGEVLGQSGDAQRELDYPPALPPNPISSRET